MAQTQSNQRFGRYLRERREAAEVSLRDLARELKISAPFLSLVERGKQSPLGPEHWKTLRKMIPEIKQEILLELFLKEKLKPGRRVVLQDFLAALIEVDIPPAQLQVLKTMLQRDSMGP